MSVQTRVQRRQRTKLHRALTACVPLAGLAATQLCVGTPNAYGAATWVGSNGSWNSASNWAGSPIPPGNTDVFIGNNGSVNVGGFTTTINRFRIGYAGYGLSNVGTGILEVEAGSLLTQQNSYFGDGAAGTLNVS